MGTRRLPVPERRCPARSRQVECGRAPPQQAAPGRAEEIGATTKSNAVEKSIVGRIQALRMVQRWTTIRLAQEMTLVGVYMTPSTIRKILCHRRHIGVDELAAFAEVFDCTPNDLMDFRGNVL